MTRYLRPSAALALVLAATFAFGQTRSTFEPLWIWSGAVTPTTAVVKAKIRGQAQDLHLRYGVDERLEAAQRAPLDRGATPNEVGVVTFELEGLVPNTRYSYALSDGERRGPIGNFRTFAPRQMSYSFGAAACAGGSPFSAISNHPIFTTIEDRRPLFFLHMGDFHYSNINRNDILLFRRAYDLVLTQRHQAALYRHVPIVYMWDDHDYGPNDSDGTSPSRDAARAAYLENVPHYPLTLHDGRVETIQQEFTVGRVRFIVTDLRSARDPWTKPDGPAKSMLGERQREWFGQALERAAAEQWPLVVWVSTVPWITQPKDREDGWQPYSWERHWIADRIEELGLRQRLVVLAGDAHSVAIDDGTNSNYATRASKGNRGFPVMQAAPLDRSPTIKGGPYSHGVSAVRGQFGWVEVDDNGDELKVTLTGHDSGGRQIRNMKLQLACRGGACGLVGGPTAASRSPSNSGGIMQLP